MEWPQLREGTKMGWREGGEMGVVEVAQGWVELVNHDPQQQR